MRKIDLKKIAALTAAAFMAGTISGCSNTGNTNGTDTENSSVEISADPAEKVLRVGFTLEPSSFDPADFTSVASCFAGYDCYDTLLKRCACRTCGNNLRM